MKSWVARCCYIGTILITTPFTNLLAQGTQSPLPNPLTLEQAIELAERASPVLDLASAKLSKAAAQRADAEANDDLRLDLTGVLGVVEPSPNAVDQSHIDNWASLRLSKRLYDFGLTRHTEAAVAANHQAAQWLFLEARLAHRLEVMQQFFDVLLSDLRFARDNEAMAMEYVRYDKARERNALGQVSDVRMLELESAYQQSRLRVTASQQQQRISRSMLAISLNRPDQLPHDLEYPANKPVALEVEAKLLIDQALQANPGLKALRAELEAAQNRLEAAQAQDNPVLRGELEAAAYDRELGGRNPLSAGLVFEMQLYDGGRTKAKEALQRADLMALRAEVETYKNNLRQQVLDHWLELERLRIKQQELRISGDYRDLNLERSRRLYELEVVADLGDSMAQIADLQYQQAETDLRMRLVQAKLQALTGELWGSDEQVKTGLGAQE